MLVKASICADRDCAACAASSPWKQRDDAAVFTKQEPAADADADEDGGEDLLFSFHTRHVIPNFHRHCYLCVGLS